MQNSFLTGGLLSALVLLVSAVAHAQVPLRNPRPSAVMGTTTPSATRPPDYPLAPAPRYAASSSPGRYRLPDGSWHSAEVYGPDMPDRVRLRPDNLPDYAIFWPAEVSAYVVSADTFVTVPAFVQRRHHQLVPASFAQRLYRDDRYEVLCYQAPTPETQRYYDTPVAPNGPTVLMPGAAPPSKSVASQTDAFNNSFLGVLMNWFVYPRAYQKMLLRHAGQVQELPAKTGVYRTFMLTLLADDPALCAQLRAGQLASRQDAPQLLATYAAHRREALLRALK